MSTAVNAIINKPQQGRKWPHFDEEAVDAVRRVLLSGKVNQWTGEEVLSFEREFSDFVEVSYSVAVANGTLSLEIALRAIGIGVGDDVIVPSRTFWGTVSAVMMVGAKPIFADVDIETGNITAETISSCMTSKTRAVIPVHVGGIPCEMDAIMDLAINRELIIIEDCAQAHGALYKGRKVGSIGHIGSFSFCQDKIMTTGGEGGMLTTNDKDLWREIWSLKDHGKSPDKTLLSKNTDSSKFKFVHDSLGTNARMTEMQAALGRWALRKLPVWLAARRRNAQLLNENFESIEYIRPFQYPIYMEPAFYRYYMHIVSDKLPDGWDRDRVIAELRENGFQAAVGTCCEVYKEGAVKRKQFHLNAIQLSEQTLSLCLDDWLKSSF